jgi:hypothetical protein
VYLWLGGPAWWAVLALLECYVGRSRQSCGARSRNGSAPDAVDTDDSVIAESRRVSSEVVVHEDGVRAVGLRKVFRTLGERSAVAVAGVTFGCRQGECLGLVGRNLASMHSSLCCCRHVTQYPWRLWCWAGVASSGKSTVMSMLTGAVTPSGGKAVVAGYDMTEQWAQASWAVGVCLNDDLLPRHLSGGRFSQVNCNPDSAFACVAFVNTRCLCMEPRFLDKTHKHPHIQHGTITMEVAGGK